MPPNDDEVRAALVAGMRQLAAQTLAASQLRGQAARDYQTQLMGEQERGLRGWLPIATGAIGALPRTYGVTGIGEAFAGINREPRRSFGGSGMWGPEPAERVEAKTPEPPRPPPIPRYERLLGEDIFGEDDE